MRRRSRPASYGRQALTRAETLLMLRRARDAYRFAREQTAKARYGLRAPEHGRSREFAERAAGLAVYYRGIGDTLTAVAKELGHAARRRYSSTEIPR